jgi:hypothetical protein
MTQAAQVQDFYERYPYPRPIDSLEDYRRLWDDRQRRRERLWWWDQVVFASDAPAR